MAAPLLTVYTLTASGFGHVRIFKEPYIGADGVEYTVVAAYKTGSTTDSIYLFKEDLSVTAGYTFTEVVTGLTKYLKYTFCLHEDRCYYTNGTDAIGWIYCDSAGAFTSGTMTNAPLGTLIISAKGALWVGGTTYSSYATGTALFTLNSKTVAGTGTSFLSNVKAGDLIGTGASPSKFYVVASVDSDTSLQLTVVFAEATTSNTNYLNKRVSNRNVYYSAEEAMNDWITPYIPTLIGAFKAGVLQINRRNTGLHNFDDAVLIFSDRQGFFIEGINPDDWQIPKNTKLPVGCISHLSIQSKDGFLGFLSDKGYYVTKNGQLSFSDLGASPFSKLLTPQFDDVDKNVADLANAFVYKDSLYISVPATSKFSLTDSQQSYSTGTVSITNGTTTVTGNSTSWRGIVMPGDQIRFGTDVDGNGDPLYYTITAIATGASGNITIERNKVGTVTTGAYVIRKRRCNRILVLDTDTNIKSPNYGWTIFDSVNADGFVLFKNKLLYGSSTSGDVYQYDTGTALYGAGITASAKTGRWDCGAAGKRKHFTMLRLRAKGTGTVYVTPIVDGVSGTQISYTFADSTQFQEVFFPRSNGTSMLPFNYIGYEIELQLDMSGTGETIEIDIPNVGIDPNYLSVN